VHPLVDECEVGIHANGILVVYVLWLSGWLLSSTVLKLRSWESRKGTLENMNFRLTARELALCYKALYQYTIESSILYIIC
jgi:hypothetical protein